MRELGEVLAMIALLVFIYAVINPENLGKALARIQSGYEQTVSGGAK